MPVISSGRSWIRYLAVHATSRGRALFHRAWSHLRRSSGSSPSTASAARPTLLRPLFLLQAGQNLLRVRMGVVQRRGLHSMLGLGQRSMQSGLGGGIALGIDDGTVTHAFARISGLGIEALARRPDQPV